MSLTAVITSSDVMNRKLSETIKDALEKKGEQVVMVNLIDENLPLFTTKYEKENGVPEQVLNLNEQLAPATGMIFVAPEYNGSYPPAHNNFIAWMSRSSDDWRELFNDKTAGIATHSGGGGQHVLSAMRSQLAFIGMNVIGRQLHTHYQKQLEDESLEQFLSIFLKQSKI